MLHDSPVNFVVFSPDNSCLLTASGDSGWNEVVTKFWDARDGTQMGIDIVHEYSELGDAWPGNTVKEIVFSPKWPSLCDGTHKWNRTHLGPTLRTNCRITDHLRWIDGSRGL